MKEEVLARVFRIAYCNYFSPHLYHEWKSICENFVINVKHTMPELLNKPKVHLILHLVDCMVNLGPCSAFSAERCESFNATVRAQNIFSNRLAPSRDICNHFAVQQHLRYTCACDGDDNIHAFQNPHMYHVVLNTIGLSCATIEDLHRHDSSTTIELFHCMEDSLVAVFKGVIVADGGLVHAGDFVELLCSETKYALFLTFCQLETGESFCVLQGCDEFVVNSEPVLNEYECPLLAKSIFSADCSQIKQAVSIVHECSDSCTFDWGSSSKRIEREASGEKALNHSFDISDHETKPRIPPCITGTMFDLALVPPTIQAVTSFALSWQYSFLLLKMESTNHGEGPVAASKRRYIPLNDVLPPLETLVVAIEGSVDPDGVCCLSIPNRVLGDWANNREKNTSFVALPNEYIVDEAITLNPEAARLEDILYRKSLGVVSKVRAARGVNRKNALLRSTTITILNGETISAADLQSELNEVTYLNEEADAFIEGLQEEVQDLKDALSEAQDSQNNPGGKIDAVSNRHARRKIQEVSEHANKALEFLSTYGLVAESLKVHTTSGKTFHIPFSDDAASENEDTVDLRVLYILDRYGIAQDATSFQPNQKIKVRISGDGAKFSRTSSFVLLSYAILMPVGRYLSGIGNHTIAVVKGAEDYDTISTAFAATFQEIDGLQQLGFVAVNGVSYNIELFFSSDMKFMLTMLGLNAANSIYACPKCTVHRDCRWDVSKPESYYSTTMARTLVTNRRAFASHGRTAAVHQGSVNRPLTAIPVDHMMIDELHLFLRIFDVMLRNLIKMSEPQTQQLVAYIRSCGVSFTIWESESSDGKVEWTSLTGEAKKKVLKLLPSKMKDIPLPNAFLDDVVQLWKDFEVLYNLLSSETPPPNAADDIHLKAKRWIQLFLRIKSDGHQKKFVTPYFHVMVYHVPDAIRQFGNMKQFSCQGVEKHKDDSKRNYFSSNHWDAPAEIMLAEHRLELLQQYAREKRHYTKHAAAYWHEGGMRSQMRETLKY
eukprot:Em0009g1147a